MLFTQEKTEDYHRTVGLASDIQRVSLMEMQKRKHLGNNAASCYVNLTRHEHTLFTQNP